MDCFSALRLFHHELALPWLIKRLTVNSSGAGRRLAEAGQLNSRVFTGRISSQSSAARACLIAGEFISSGLLRGCQAYRISAIQLSGGF